jgi:hypothetical protein
MKNTFKFLVGTVAAFALTLVVASTASAAYTHTGLLKMGMSSSQVKSLQQTLNGGGFLVSTTGAGSPGMESMYFGAKTKEAVIAFQSAKGLGADGIVGAQTGTALAAMTGGSVSYPAGCSSTTGYSTTTGVKCDSTGGSTSGGSTSTGGLSGGAADITVSKHSTDVESNVREGEEEVAIAGFEIEADGGDVSVTSVRVTLAKSAVVSGESDRLENYIDEVSIWFDGKKVGSADASDFSRDTTTAPDTYTETIQLSGAVVREDDEEKFLVAVTAVDSIDVDEQDATFNFDLEVVRFTDSTGAILSDDVTYSVEGFGFEDASEGDDLELKSSSDNPEDATTQVEEDNSSDAILALVAKLNNDEDSSDATLYDIPVTIAIDNYGSDADTADDIIDEVMVEIDGEEYEADLSGAGTLNVDGTTAVDVTYNLDLDGDVVIDAGDEAVIKVWITFKEQEDNYDESTTIEASIAASAIDAEGEDEEFTVTGGTKTGALLTLSLGAATVEVTDISSEKNEDDTVGTFSFEFTIEAEGEDITLTNADIVYTILGTDTSSTSDVLSFLSGDATENSSENFTISEGDSATFVFDVTHNPDNAGVYRVRLDSIDGNDLGDDEIAGPQTLDAA